MVILTRHHERGIYVLCSDEDGFNKAVLKWRARLGFAPDELPNLWSRRDGDPSVWEYLVTCEGVILDHASKVAEELGEELELE